MKRLVIILLLLIPLVAAEEVDNYNNFDKLVLEITTENELSLTTGEVTQLVTELTFFPKNYDYQIVENDIFTTPSATVDEDAERIQVTWDETISKYSYRVESTVTRNSEFIKVYDKPEYPVTSNSNVAKYLEESEFINITPKIEAQAREIIGGEDDLYKIIYKLANWTETNIEYDLNTITSSSVQPSSWVLENRQGVCDELTNLFISFCRSLGIPARFVSGIAYTNTIHDFGPHGWAEVYIDDQWIPVDVTYGMYGWIDPSHVKFKDTVDSGESSASFLWKGKNIDLDIGALDVSTVVVSSTGESNKYIEMSIESLATDVGPSSYVPIQVNLKNNNNYYVPVKISLTKAPTVIGSNTKNVLLLPNEERSVFWMVQVNSEPEENLVYTTYIEVETMYGSKAESEFTFAKGRDITTKEEAEDIIANLYQNEDISTLDVELDCDTDKGVYYKEDQGTLTCLVQGTIDELCFNDDCKTEDFVWTLNIANLNSQRYTVIAKKGNSLKYEYIDINIVDVPKFQITEVTPTTLDYKEEVEMSFIVKTESPIRDISLDIEDYGNLILETLYTEHSFLIPVKGKNFASGNMNIIITYKDSQGKEYQDYFTQEITVTNIPWFAKITLFFKNLF
ncbi:MAG: transglutaminase domain-containing protein [archaeon]